MGRSSWAEAVQASDVLFRGRALERLMEQLDEWGIKGVAVRLDGETAFEWFEGGTDKMASIYSCTKSILACLVGLALDRGWIGSVEDPVASYVSHPAFDLEPTKRRIRIADLLTMTSGLDWPDFDKPYRAMRQAEDPVAYVLDRPLAHEPGAAFAYNSGGSHVLAALLTAASGSDAGELAANRLKGISEGGAGLHLFLRDLAAFGDLILDEGCWKGEQLLPKEWIRRMVSPHHKGLQHYEPRIYGSYGYHWWVSSACEADPLQYHFAFGYGGQYLFVVPSLRLVVAVRKRLDGRNNALFSRKLMLEYVVQAVQ